jgi:hypothetical protein
VGNICLSHSHCIQNNSCGMDLTPCWHYFQRNGQRGLSGETILTWIEEVVEN